MVGVKSYCCNSKRKEREPTLAELLFVKENDWKGYLYWKKTIKIII